MIRVIIICNYIARFLYQSTIVALDKNSLLFDRKLETATEGLPREFINLLNKLSREDAMTVMDYVIALNAETNPTDNYRESVIRIITTFIMFCRRSTDKPLKQLGREDVLAFLDHEHPQPGNPNAIFLSGNRRSFGRALGIRAIETIYRQYKTEFFPKLLDSSNVLPEDKQKMRDLLKKPWNPIF